MKKTLMVLLTAALALGAVNSVFAGGQQSSGSSGSGENMANKNPVGALPIVKQKENFTFLIDNNGTVEKKLVYPFFEKDTNVHVNWMLFPYATALERKNILMSTGDYPDAIGGWILSETDVMTMSREGTIIPLENLIDQYAPNIKKALDIPGVRANMTLPDGHIYSPPYVIEEPLVSFSPWINQKWLDQLGLKMPATTAEFKQVLIAFRDRIPNVNGQKIIPFSGDPNNLGLGTLAGWFGVNASNGGVNAGYLALINGQVESSAIRPEYKEFIKYFADLYKEGLIDPELFTQDNATWKAKGKLGLYGVSFAYGSGDFAPELRTPDLTPWLLNYTFQPLPVLKGPNVSKPLYRRNGFGVTTFRTQMVITDKAKNPVTIIRWLDYTYDELHSLENARGPAGVLFEKIGDHQYREISRKVGQNGWTQADADKYAWGEPYVYEMPKYLRPKTEVTILPPEGEQPVYDELGPRDKLYEPYLEAQPMPQVWLAGADATRAADLQTAITEYVKQKQAQWISGQANVDAEWDAYLAQLNRLGLQELLTIKRNAIK
ncbi:ABC transporter substrate-binding protein [Spirochaetia bacterium]|nr:ABC transporter substrate-binding protein [Spirochaetia bacterium]